MMNVHLIASNEMFCRLNLLSPIAFVNVIGTNDLQQY